MALCVWVPSLSIMFSRLMYPVAFLWPNRTPSYGCSRFRFFHAWAGGQLGCFRLLAIVSNAAVACVCKFPLGHVLGSPGCIPRSGIAGSHSYSLFGFLRSCQTCSQWLHHLTSPPAMYKASCFSTSSPTFVMSHSFNLSHSSEYEVVSRCGFDLPFPKHWYWAAYLCLLASYVCVIFREMSVEVLCLVFKLVVLLLLSFKSFIVFWVVDPYQIHDFSIMFFHSIIISLFGSILWGGKVFKFWWSMPSVIAYDSHPQPQVFVLRHHSGSGMSSCSASSGGDEVKTSPLCFVRPQTRDEMEGGKRTVGDVSRLAL